MDQLREINLFEDVMTQVHGKFWAIGVICDPDPIEGINSGLMFINCFYKTVVRSFDFLEKSPITVRVTAWPSVKMFAYISRLASCPKEAYLLMLM